MDAAAQRHAAFEVEHEFNAAGLDFVGQIAAGLDHLDHPFGARRLFEKLIDLIEGGLQIAPGILRMGIGVAADSINGEVDAVADQARRDGVADGRFFADGCPIQLLIDIAVAFHHYMLLQHFFSVHVILLSG